jgi:hypothetical protein
MIPNDREGVVSRHRSRDVARACATFGLLQAVSIGTACRGSDPDMSAPDTASFDVGPDMSNPPSPNVRLADTVVDAPGATGTGVGDPMRAVNGVRGGGTSAGGMDVFSRGYQVGQNDYITLAWSNGRLLNGPGADLVVFENPFLITGGGSFMDLMIVEVSIDGIEFRALAHEYTAADPTMYRDDPALWSGFAGRTPVLLHAEMNPVDPFDAVAAGGDQLDLDTVVGSDALANAIRAGGVSFVRLVCAPARVNPATGANYVRGPVSNGGDIDGVYGRYVTAP